LFGVDDVLQHVVHDDQVEGSIGAGDVLADAQQEPRVAFLPLLGGKGASERDL
jgi:hypothetical protein